jgi:hypothetical protein
MFGNEPNKLSCPLTLGHVRVLVLTMSITGPDLYSHVTVTDTDRTLTALTCVSRVSYFG